MARYKRKIVAHPPSYGDKKRELEESMLEYTERVRQMNTDKYGQYDNSKLRTSWEIRSQNNRSWSEDYDRLRHHRHSDTYHLGLLLSNFEKEHYPKTKIHVEYEKLRLENKSERPLIALAAKDDFAQTHTSESHKHRTMSSGSASHLYELADSDRQDKVLNGTKVLNEADGIELIKEFDFRSQRPLYWRDLGHLQRPKDGENSHNVLQEKQQVTGKVMNVVDVEDNSTLLTSRNSQNGYIGKGKYRSFPTINARNDVDMKSFDSGNSLPSESKVEIMNYLPKTDASPADILTVQTEFQHLNSSKHIPVRLLQRPARAKRMDLHEPDLQVIPEVGGTFVHSENMHSARKDMLSFVPLCSKSCLYANNNRIESEKNRNARDTSDLQRKRPQETSLESNNSKSDLPYYQTGCSGAPVRDIERSALTGRYAHLPWETYDEQKQWSRDDFSLRKKRSRKH